MRIFFKLIGVLLLLFIASVLVLSLGKDSENISYGISFSKLHADELRLPWEEVYTALLDDLGVRKLRLSAHWPMIEPEDDKYNFKELDYQIIEAEKRGAEVILAFGRRLPGWPECHEPVWAKERPWEDRKNEIREYIETVVNRYKNYEHIAYWQIENEPFLTVFAREYCGGLDEEFLDEEIRLVRSIDPSRPILLTDSGNLGLWYPAWKRGDTFGTSVYMYLWNPTVGKIRSIYWPSFYKFKTSFMEILGGPKKSFLAELSLEPFLLKPIVETSLEEQLDRMDGTKFDEVMTFARKTGFDVQYLWGAEWWYYMKENGHEEFWEKAKELFILTAG